MTVANFCDFNILLFRFHLHMPFCHLAFAFLHFQFYIMFIISCKLLLKVVSTTFLLVCVLCLKESIRESRKNVFYFTSKALFVLEIIKF